MGPAAFIIAIFGCGEGEAPCEPVRRLEQVYASEAACADATETALTRHGDADYPLVVARCQPAGAASAPLKADEVRLPDPAPPVRTAAAGREG